MLTPTLVESNLDWNKCVGLCCWPRCVGAAVELVLSEVGLLSRTVPVADDARDLWAADGQSIHDQQPFSQFTQGAAPGIWLGS